MSCEETRELAVELALGIADGEARARALEHVEGCADCRREVERQSRVAERLLALAPAQAPPAGFEARVLTEIGELGVGRAAARKSGRRPRRLWPRALAGRPALAAVLAAVAAASLTAGGLVAAFHGDVRLAGQYRATLARANGSSFAAAPLRSASGGRAGVVFAYQGSPSWVLVTLDAPSRAVARRVELVARGGGVIAPASARVPAGAASWGGAIPLDADELVAVRLVGPDAARTLTAPLYGVWDP